MFDVTTARKITYGPNNDLQTTVFQDRTDKSEWYMVPVPRLRLQDGQPVFALTGYTANTGSAGVCSFEVELYVPDDARKAAEKILPAPVTWGDFTWVSGDVFFDFELEGKGRELTATPTLFGTNVASFQVELASEAEVKSFVAAFTGGGPLSPFRIRYDMGVLTQLLAGQATVRYDASAAITYSRTYQTSRDKWGNSHTVLVETRRNLQESGAGKTEVTFGPNVTDEVKQIVRDWAWSTLEKQVSAAVNAALALAQNNEDPVSATTSFTATYAEDATVEWSTPVSSFLPSFTPEVWAKVYREVDNRELSVNFQLVGNPVKDGAFLYTDVVVEVDYPTKTTGNTFTLRPQASGDAGALVSHTYTAPGGSGVFDPHYKYRFKVSYPGDQPPYQSEWIEETATQIVFRPDAFGIRKVDFVGSNIPFKTVDVVYIDFYENPPAGFDPKLQTKEMRKNGDKISFLSTYHTPLTNTYSYRLRFVLKDKSMLVVEPGPAFGAANADVVPVLDPTKQVSFMVVAIVTDKDKGFAQIDINADYQDIQNKQQAPTHSWSEWAPKKKGPNSSKPWNFTAAPSVQTAYFQASGQIIYGNDYQVFTLDRLKANYSLKPLILRDDDEVYSVSIITDQVDWSVFASVQLNVFQMTNADGTVSSAHHTPPKALLVAPSLRTSLQNAELKGKVAGLLASSLLPPIDGVEKLPLFYMARRLRTAADIVFYYNATYIYKDKAKPPVSVDDTAVSNELQLVLPANPKPSVRDHINRVSVAIGRR